MIKNMRSWLGIVLAVGLLGGLPTGRALGQQATQPSANGSGRRPGPNMVVQRFKTAVAQLDLTDDEKSKVGQILDDATQKAQQMTADFQDAPPKDRYQKLIAFFQDIHQQLAQVLTGDQMKTLDQKVGRGLGQGSTTRPAGGILANLQDALSKLDLSADQKDQIQQLMDSTRQKMADLRQKAADGTDIQLEMQQLRKDVRTQIQSILTPDQLQMLLDQMPRAGQRVEAQAPPPTDTGPKSSQPRPADMQSTGPDAGDPAPDVTLVELSGHPFTPAKYKGHVLVLEFGSLSSPTFRDHVQDMEKLKMAEGPRAFFIIVYTREAFPAGEKQIDRNDQDGISVAAARNLDDRKAAAGDAVQRLNITIPMAIDAMDDSVADAFGGFPNGAVVIGKDGNIAAHENWTNPDSLRRAIDEANEK
jgi:hypothetical protein